MKPVSVCARGLRLLVFGSWSSRLLRSRRALLERRARRLDAVGGATGASRPGLSVLAALRDAGSSTRSLSRASCVMGISDLRRGRSLPRAPRSPFAALPAFTCTVGSCPGSVSIVFSAAFHCEGRRYHHVVPQVKSIPPGRGEANQAVGGPPTTSPSRQRKLEARPRGVSQVRTSPSRRTTETFAIRLRLLRNR
jgi:hypothetical protein